MTKLSNKFMADNKKAHTENGMDFLRQLESYEQANSEQLIQNQTAVKLSEVVQYSRLEQIERNEDNEVEALGDHKWGNPKSISQTLPAVKSITPDMLPKSLYNYIFDNASRLNAPLEFIAMPLVVGLGSVIGTKVSILPKKHDDWENIANFWGGIIGNPSSKKTPSLNVGLKPLENLKIKAKKDFENANKNYNAQNLVNLNST